MTSKFEKLSIADRSDSYINTMFEQEQPQQQKLTAESPSPQQPSSMTSSSSAADQNQIINSHTLSAEDFENENENGNETANYEEIETQSVTATPTTTNTTTYTDTITTATLTNERTSNNNNDNRSKIKSKSQKSRAKSKSKSKSAHQSRLLSASFSARDFQTPSDATIDDPKRAMSETLMRFLLRIMFSICVCFVLSTLVFFILGAAQVIPEFAKFPDRIHDINGAHNRNHFLMYYYPSISTICEHNQRYCFRSIFFFACLILFSIMFVMCVMLFIIRSDLHPLRPRSLRFILVFCFAEISWTIWGSIGLIYAPTWLGCNTEHLFYNTMYPLLLFPYYFRAYRIKKIYDQASHHQFDGSAQNNDYVFIKHTSTINHENSVTLTNDNTATTVTTTSNLMSNNKVNSANNLSSIGNIISVDNIFDHNENSRTQIHTIADGDEFSKNNYNNNNSSGFNLESALVRTQRMEWCLNLIFAVSLIPFVIVSVSNYFTGGHWIPGMNKYCDAAYKKSSVFIWGGIHLLEISILILTVYWIRSVRQVFSIKDELIIISVFDALFVIGMIGFKPDAKSIDDGVLVLYLVLMRAVGFFIVTIIHPLLQTFSSELSTNLEDMIITQDVISSLDDILEDMDAMLAFRRFLTVQKSQYLLDFWMEVDLFKDGCLNHEFLDVQYEAMIIFKKYFDPQNESKKAVSVQRIVGDYFCANLVKIFLDSKKTSAANKKRGGGSRHRNRNKNNRQKKAKAAQQRKILPEIFDFPHQKIFEHMERFSYRQFLHSEYCKEFLATVAGQEEIFRKLISQDIL